MNKNSFVNCPPMAYMHLTAVNKELIEAKLFLKFLNDPRML